VRQAILVVVLVGASFLGGALVNGPGLQWAKTRLLRSLGINDSGEITAIDLKATPHSEVPSGSSSTQTEGSKLSGPVAPVPSVIGENPDSTQDANQQVHSHPTPKSGKGTPNPLSSSTTSSAPPRSATLNPGSLKPATQAAASNDPQVKKAKGTSSSTSSTRTPRSAPVILESRAALLPPAPLASDSPSGVALSARSARTPALDSSDGWGLLERKMQTLGVSRFTIDAEPGGRVLFSCLIPVAGRQAVSQRFEAEGDDMLQAANATLRRIGLWRAAQAPSR
jgi:hypothetical protein